jgi:hypothetical protein
VFEIGGLKKTADQKRIGFFQVAVIGRVLFADPLWEKMATHEDRKFVVMWAIPPTNHQKYFGNFFGNFEWQIGLNVEKWICWNLSKFHSYQG